MWIAIANGIGTRQGVGGGVGPTPPPYTPPLDTYTDAAVAYSVRLLRTAYSGSSMRVRRFVPPYDEQDIGFTAAGDLDEAAIVAFGGSDALTVSAWYDQSGQSNHAEQITPGSQPEIYDGAAVITENGKPAVYLSGTQYMSPSEGFTTFPQSTFNVFRKSATGIGGVWGLGGNYSDTYNHTEIVEYNGDLRVFYTPTSGSFDSVSIAVTQAEQTLVATNLVGSNATIYKNSQESATKTNLGGATTEFLFLKPRHSLGVYLQESIFYESDQDPAGNRTSIESNINGYFDIYTVYNPDPATSGFLFDYPDAAAAYSVRQLNNNATSAMRVRRTVAPFDEQDIGFDGSGDLDESAISTFGGTDPLTVSAWYDQSSQQRHAEQITPGNQPQIYDGAAVITENEKPAVDFLNNNGPLLTFTQVDFTGAMHLSSVLMQSSFYYSFGGDGGNTFTIHISPTTFRYSLKSPIGNFTASSTLSDNEQFITQLSRDSSNQIETFVNDVAGDSRTNSGDFGFDRIGGRTTGNYRDKIQEFILWTADHSANQSDISTNINTYFDIYTEYNPDPATSGFLFDYPDAAAAYSVRQLNNNATYAMRVRRTVAPFDEQDIGFDGNGDLDETAITTFGGSDVLTVSSWYDQSGDQNHAEQITPGAQPEIYNGTAVITENGKAFLKFRGGNGGNESLSMATTVTCETMFSVVANDTAGFLAYYLYSSGANVGFYSGGTFQVSANGPGVLAGATSASISGTVTGQTLLYNDHNGTGWEVGQDGGTASQAIATTSKNIDQIVRPTTNLQVEKFQECIIWDIDKSSNRTAIETNINTYFTIY